MIKIALGVVIGIMLAKKVPWVMKLKIPTFKIVKVVKFKDGKYARRAGLFGLYWYKDMRSSGHWWTRGGGYFSDCLVNTYEEAATPADKGTATNS